MAVPNPHTSDIIANNLHTTIGGIYEDTDGIYQYAIWYDLAGKPRVGRIERGVQRWGVDHQEHSFSPADLKLLLTNGTSVDDDDHNFPAITRDGRGHIHIWTDMHYDPYHALMSARPNDITEWVDARSQHPASGAIETTYPIPVAFADGSLLFSLRWGPGRMDHASGASNRSFSYRTPTGTAWGPHRTVWQGLNVPGAGPNGTAGPGYPVGTRETNPRYPDSANTWGPYITIPLLEDLPDGVQRMHVAWVWRVWGNDRNAEPAEGRVAGRTNVFPSYGYSDDKGLSWYAVDGTALTLPITPLNNPQCQIRDEGIEAPEGWWNWGGMCVDDLGRPHLTVSIDPHYHLFWNGTKWVQEEILRTRARHTVIGRMNAAWIRGHLFYLATGTPVEARRQRLWRLGPPAVQVTMSGPVTDGRGAWEPSYDMEAYRQFGTVESLAPDGDSPRVFTFGGGARQGVRSTP